MGEAPNLNLLPICEKSVFCHYFGSNHSILILFEVLGSPSKSLSTVRNAYIWNSMYGGSATFELVANSEKSV